ncbi:hypothetical protein EJB05_50871, partial [Eragrostis curvula]
PFTSILSPDHLASLSLNQSTAGSAATSKSNSLLDQQIAEDGCNSAQKSYQAGYPMPDQDMHHPCHPNFVRITFRYIKPFILPSVLFRPLISSTEKICLCSFAGLQVV